MGSNTVEKTLNQVKLKPKKNPQNGLYRTKNRGSRL